MKVNRLKLVNVDTTVREKHIRFPTDARLYDRAGADGLSRFSHFAGILIDGHLKGHEGDTLNAIFSAAGMNYSKLLKVAENLLRLIFWKPIKEFFDIYEGKLQPKFQNVAV